MLPLRDNVPTRTFPFVTIGLIAANTAAWLWEWRTGVTREVFRYGYYPCSVWGPCVAPASEVRHVGWDEGFFTALFLHAGWLHIAGNMLFLWIFGNNVEDAMGHVRFALFYVAAGITAAAAQSAVTFAFGGAPAASIPNVGASGAIAGVLGAYLVLLPRARVLTLVVFFFLEIRAVVFLWIWFAFQLWRGGVAVTHPQAGGGVAFFAHVGGFAFGMLTVRALTIRKPLSPAY